MTKASDAAAEDISKKGDAKPSWTDMSAVITDNKSGVPDRSTKLTHELRAQENSYRRDMIKKTYGGAFKAHDDAAKEEEILKRIERDLGRLDLLENDLKEENTLETIGNESEFTSTGNIKTDFPMKMTDKSVKSPDKGGKSTCANLDDCVKAYVDGGITDHCSHIYELSETMPGHILAMKSNYARDVKDAKNAPPRQGDPSRMKRLAGLPNVSTKTFAYITDNSSKLVQLSNTMRDRLRPEEQSYVWDVHPHPSLQQEHDSSSHGLPSPPGNSKTGASDRGPGVGVGGCAGGDGAEVYALASNSPEVRLSAKTAIELPYVEDSEGRTGGEKSCWFIPESVLRGISNNLARYSEPPASRFCRPSMPDMEADDMNSNSYFPRRELQEGVYDLELGQVMYAMENSAPTAAGRNMRHITDNDYDICYQNEPQQQIKYKDTQGYGMTYAGEEGWTTTDDENGELRMLYQDEETTVTNIEDQDDQMMYRAQNDELIVYHREREQQIRKQRYPYPKSHPEGQTYCAGPVQNYNRQGNYTGICMSESDIDQGWQKEYITHSQPNQQISGVYLRVPAVEPPLGRPMGSGKRWADRLSMEPFMRTRQQVGGLSEPGMLFHTSQEMLFRVPSTTGGISSTEQNGKPEMKTAAVQTLRNLPISAAAQTEGWEQETKSAYANTDTDEGTAQHHRHPDKATDAQTYGTSPYAPGADLPNVCRPQMAGFIANSPIAGQLGMPRFPNMMPQLRPTPPPPPPAPVPPQCEDCIQQKPRCEGVPFENLKRNIEEDIVNIVKANSDVKVSDQDTKILVARSDSPYKLVYLIPQRPHITKEEKGIQTTKESEHKGIQTVRIGNDTPEQTQGDDDNKGSKIVMSTTNINESQANGKHVLTSKEIRVDQLLDDENGPKIFEHGDSPKLSRRRSKRRSSPTSKTTGAGVPLRSLTISMGRRNSVERRSSPIPRRRRGCNRSASMDAAFSVRRGPGSPPDKDAKRRKESMIAGSSGNSLTSISIIGGPSSSNIGSPSTSRNFDRTIHASSRSSSSTSMQLCRAAQSPTRGSFATSPFKVTPPGKLNGRMDTDRQLKRLEPRLPQAPVSNEMFAEGLYRSHPEKESPSSDRVVSKSLRSPRSPVHYACPLVGNRSSSPRQRKPPKVAQRARSKSCLSSSSVDYQSRTCARGEPVLKTSSYIQIEQIATRIAQQIAPQIETKQIVARIAQQIAPQIAAARKMNPQARIQPLVQMQQSMPQDSAAPRRRPHRQPRQIEMVQDAREDDYQGKVNQGSSIQDASYQEGKEGDFKAGVFSEGRCKERRYNKSDRRDGGDQGSGYALYGAQLSKERISSMRDSREGRQDKLSYSTGESSTVLNPTLRSIQQSEQPTRLLLRKPNQRRMVASASQTVYPTYKRQRTR